MEIAVGKKLKRAKHIVTFRHSFNIARREFRIDNCCKTFVEEKSLRRFVTVTSALLIPTCMFMRVDEDCKRFSVTRR